MSNNYSYNDDNDNINYIDRKIEINGRNITAADFAKNVADDILTASSSASTVFLILGEKFSGKTTTLRRIQTELAKLSTALYQG